MPLFETSAKADEKCDHVEAIFLTLAHKINANKLLFKSRDGNNDASGNGNQGDQDVVKVDASNANNQEDDNGGSWCC